MSATTDAKLDPTEEHTTSSEPSSAQHETDTTTQANGTEEDKTKHTYTDMATSAATSAATTATAAAAGVKDNVFSMFGGGAKKEKREEPDELEDRSGSSKAKKDAEAAEAEAEGEVRSKPAGKFRSIGLLTVCFALREKMLPNPQKYTSSRWYISPRKSKPKPTKN